jgi:hypothetical protein
VHSGAFSHALGGRNAHELSLSGRSDRPTALIGVIARQLPTTAGCCQAVAPEFDVSAIATSMVELLQRCTSHILHQRQKPDFLRLLQPENLDCNV